MDRKGTYIIAGIIVFSVIGFIAISFQKTTLDPGPQVQENIASTTAWENTPAETVATPKTVITAKHAYRKNLHIVAGEVPLPTACEILEATTITSADKKQVIVQLLSSIKTGEKCPSDITPARFKVSAKADKDATLSATYNGQPVTLNLIEASPDEDLDNFELYIKG